MTAVPYARRMFNGGATATTIPTGIGASDTSFTVALATNWPSGSSGDFYVDVDRGLPTEEKILCSSTSSLVVTVASGGRGADGTSAVAHSPGCTVQVVHVAQDDDEANQVVNAVLGQASAAKGDILAMLSAAGPNTLTRIPVAPNGGLYSAASGLPATTLAGSTGQLLQSAGSSVPTFNSTLLQGIVSSSAGSGNTGNATYTTLGTSAAVTVTTGTKALVLLSAQLTNSTISSGAVLSVAVSGATTIASNDVWSIAVLANATGSAVFTLGTSFVYGGGGGAPGALTAGSNTFTAQLKAVTNPTAFASGVIITVIPLN